MPIILDDFEQRSPEWVKHRLGSPGCSSISRIITTKGEPSKQRDEYLRQLAAEIITGRSEESDFLSRAMLNGIEREDSSRALFSMITGLEVRQAGIVFKDERRRCHCSPDGLIGDGAVLEMKNPMAKVHLKSLLEGKMPTEYYGQCQMSMYVCERPLCYYMSNSEGLPPFILEVKPDIGYMMKLEQALDDFHHDLMAMVEKIREKGRE